MRRKYNVKLMILCELRKIARNEGLILDSYYWEVYYKCEYLFNKETMAIIRNLRDK